MHESEDTADDEVRLKSGDEIRAMHPNDPRAVAAIGRQMTAEQLLLSAVGAAR